MAGSRDAPIPVKLGKVEFVRPTNEVETRSLAAELTKMMEDAFARNRAFEVVRSGKDALSAAGQVLDLKLDSSARERMVTGRLVSEGQKGGKKVATQSDGFRIELNKDRRGDDQILDGLRPIALQHYRQFAGECEKKA